MIPYGGDGTLLEAVQLLPNSSIPVVGINCGRLGYLTADNGEGIEELLERIAVGNISYQRRDMLRISGDVMCGGHCLALNEVAIHRHGATMISIETFVDENRMATYHGDGLVISTPTGSTAYSLSAGGPVVDPMCNCFILSPIAPHNLTMRPIVMPDTSIVTLRIDTRNNDASISIDNRTFKIADNTILTIKKAKRYIRLAVPHNISFFDSLRNKMMWGVDIR
jgi:NAD+ kinase